MVAYLLCEMKSRDFASGVLIAKHLIDLGHQVVLGQRWEIGENAMHHVTKGVALFRTANDIQAQGMGQLRAMGHAVVAMDEEALSFAGAAQAGYATSAALRNSNVFVANSAAHAAAVKSKFSAGQVEVTGNPRIEALHSDQTKPQDGPYVLFNTSFGLTNSLWGTARASEILSALGGGHSEWLQTRIEFETKTAREMRRLMRWLVKSNQRVVVRPHPSENPETWMGLRGVEVVKGSNPISWIKGAGVVVHANSTTGLESAMLGRPCVNIAPPAYREWTSRFVMGALNYTVPAALDAVRPLASYLTDKTGPLSVDQMDHGFIKDGARRIAAVMNELLVKHPRVKVLPWTKTIRTPAQEAKFTVSMAEMASVAPWASIRKLGDSVFLMTKR